MNVIDLATVVAALATAGAGVSAGWPVFMFRVDRRKQDHAERAGVAFTWEPRIEPRTAEPDGLGTWGYVITTHNPGRLPVRNVEVLLLTFPCMFRRVHDDQHLEEPASRLDVGIPVLLGGVTKQWRRTLRMPFDEPQSFRDIVATITFVDMDGETHTNEWRSLAHARQ